MNNEREKYVNPFTDFGFKRLFGEEVNKDLLMDFLNEILREYDESITSLQYLKTERLGITSNDRKAIFDIYCENEKGEKFIVEMQKNKQNFFKDRSVYYTTFPIQEQAKKTKWNFELKAVYTIGILDFVFKENKKDTNKFRYDVKLQDIDTNEVFYDKLTLIYFEMPKFNKTVDQLKNRYEKWLYVLKNLHRLQNLPNSMQEKIFEKVFEVAEVAKFTRDDYMTYEDSLKYYRDSINILDTAKQDARKKGLEEGLEEGYKKGIEQGIEKGIEQGIEKGIENRNIEIAKMMLQDHESIEKIMLYTSLTEEEIKAIRNK